MAQIQISKDPLNKKPAASGLTSFFDSQAKNPFHPGVAAFYHYLWDNQY